MTRSTSTPAVAMCARHFQMRSRPTERARRLVAPFRGKPTRGAIHNRRPPRLGRALSPRRRHVQFNVEKSGALERALVAPIPVKWASACRALISACSRNDLDFADNMAARLGCGVHERIGRHDGAGGEIIGAASGALAVLIILDGEGLS